MNRKKIISIIALLLIPALLYMGCSGGETQSEAPASESSAASTSSAAEAPESDSGAPAADGGGLSAPGEYPITQETSNLKVLMQNTAQVEDFATNEFTKWYEEKTNVHAEFELLPVVDGTTKLNLILSSGDYPDIVMNAAGGNNPMTPSQVMAYATQGIFIPLGDLVEEHAAELNKVFAAEETAYLKNLLTYPDGELYYLPDINQCYHCSISTKMWIYQPWLDELNLEMPTTIEEYAEVLRAFRDQDPNGNGKADEIPYSTQKDSNPNFLMNSFIYCDNELSLKLEDGKVRTSVNKDEWREGLSYMNSLYAEGLIAPETFTQDWDQMKQLGEYPDYALLGSATGLHTGMFCQFYGESGRWLEYVIVPPLTGPDGRKPTTQYNPYQAGVDTMVTDHCENPVLAVKWIDGMYETEAVMRSIFGRPDQEWMWAEEGDIGINGEPAIFKLLIPWAETVQNITWAQAGPQARTNTFRMGETVKPEDPLESLLYQATKQYEPFAPPYEEVLPPQVFTDEQATELADIEKALKDYVKEMNARFIMGDADLETEWDTYVQTLDGMGMERLLEINQEAYDLKASNS